MNERGRSAASAEVSVTTPSRAEDLIQNAGFWCPDNSAEVIQAHGGFIAKFGDTYYRYGEDKRHQQRILPKRLGVCLAGPGALELPQQCADPASHPNLLDAKIERLKVLYNATTGKYVLWGHWEVAANYNRGEVAVAIGDIPDGDFASPGQLAGPTPTKTAPATTLATSPSSRTTTAAYLISSTRDNRDLAIYGSPPTTPT